MPTAFASCEVPLTNRLLVVESGALTVTVLWTSRVPLRRVAPLTVKAFTPGAVPIPTLPANWLLEPV